MRNKTQIDLFTGKAPEAPLTKPALPALINIWFTATGEQCMIVLKGEQVYLYHCPCCGGHNQWDKITTGTCNGCKAKEGRGFVIDKNKQIAIVSG